MMKKLAEAAAEEEVAEEVVVDVTKPRVAEDKMPNRLSRRPRKTSPPYEETDL